MGKVKELPLFLFAGSVAAFVSLVLLWTSMITVGYGNLAVSGWHVSGWHVSGLVDRAMEVPLEPGSTVFVAPEGDALIPARYSRHIQITREDDGSRFLVLDRGGGHLGIQGYVYHPEASDTEQVHQDAFGGFEGREVHDLIGSWWRYHSPEER
jgi:hypothetical protein